MFAVLGPGGGFGGAEAWETQVDRIFSSLSERYLCHHLVEPHAVKRAVEELRSPTEAVQVYADSGYAVVVGEPEEVMARIRSLPVRRELPVAQRKLGLVEAEFKRECPGVRATVRPGVIVLEGPEAEVQAAEAKLQHLLGSIEERSVQLQEGVLGFLEHSGAIARYQARFGRSLPGPVSLEVGGGSLLLASSSPEALRPAEATLRAELSQAEVRLHGNAGVSPHLDRVKELLRAAGDQANISEPGVEVRFLPGATTVTVLLAGLTPQVNRLRDLLDDHLANQASAREELDLPRPEMASCFQQLLDLMGTRPGGVILETYGAPRPKVVVSGPRRRVQEARRALAAAMAAVAVETVVLDGPGARRHFRGDGKVNKELVERSCRVLILEQPDANATGGRTSSGPPTDTAPPTQQMNEVHLNIKLGSLEDEQVNVLVLPMLNKQLDATKVGKDLLTKAGAALRFKFAAAAAERPVAPGDVLQLDGPPTLGCSRILLIECSPWDGVRGGSLRALSRGLKTCFDLCVQRDFCSVAVPVIGPGPVLKYPLTEAAQALGDAVRQFGGSPSSGCLSAIHVVVKPGYPNSEECYYEVHKQLSSNLNQAGPVVFRSLATDVDQISMVIGGGVRLHVVFGDITNETTDAVVNTTDFVNFEKDGVCKDILTIAGPEVEAELRAASVGRGEVFVSHPGGFPCAAIFHVSGKRDPGLIEGLVLKVLDHCESFEFSSVAIPAICAGSGRLAPGAVASAVLGGVRLATSLGPTRCLTDIRLVLLRADVFLAFKEEATQMFLAQKRRVSTPRPAQTHQPAPAPPPHRSAVGLPGPGSPPGGRGGRGAEAAEPVPRAVLQPDLRQGAAGEPYPGGPGGPSPVGDPGGGAPSKGPVRGPDAQRAERGREPGDREGQRHAARHPEEGAEGQAGGGPVPPRGLVHPGPEGPLGEAPQGLQLQAGAGGAGQGGRGREGGLLARRPAGHEGHGSGLRTNRRAEAAPEPAGLHPPSVLGQHVPRRVHEGGRSAVVICRVPEHQRGLQPNRFQDGHKDRAPAERAPATGIRG
ncbi:uncharacterized protein ACNS7B_021169 [Menidia menidia]